MTEKYIYIHPGTAADAKAFAERQSLPITRVVSARQARSGALRGMLLFACVIEPDTPTVPRRTWASLYVLAQRHNEIVAETRKAGA